ncbi:MAG: lytic transglycosylase domain-containing protein [Deltaproteobacteria bacterium]|jgi:hypothetical protein|nr:lytic transglycosylase domain-containing protein [Deltaproteobacteria bacterium]
MPNDPEKTMGNLISFPRNAKASQASLRRPGNVEGLLRAQFMNPGGALETAGGSEFEAMMAANQSQNKIIADVLEGPVSPQTQRQLARIQAMNRNHPVADEIAESQKISSEESVAAAARARTGRRTLSGGSTIIKGGGTGGIFNPSQLAAYRQKHGYKLRLPDAGGITATDGTSSGGRARRASVDTSVDPIGLPSSRATRREKKGGTLNPDNLSLEELKKLAGPGEKQNREKIEKIINKAANALGLEPALVKAVVKAESNFDSKAVSKAGAKGLMQLMPRTAREMGVDDPFDPLQNVWGGARYLKRMMDRHGGNVNKALASYNWGPGNVDRHGTDGALPRETRSYIEKVRKNYDNYKKTETMEA